MANNSGLSKRAALRQQQELEERAAKNRKIMMIGAAVLGVIVLAVVAIAITQSIGRTGAATAEQLTPPNATEEQGITVASQDVEPTGDVPHLIIWQDYQCPACAYREQDYGPSVNELLDSGQITVEYRTATFMDNNAPGDASKRAAMAAAAADEVGMYRDYHTMVFANQGGGYPNQLLRDTIPQQIGMTGDDLSRFQELYDGRAFSDFADASNQAFNDSPWTGTPTYEVDGQRLEFSDPQTQEVLIMPSAQDLLRAINEVAGN